MRGKAEPRRILYDKLGITPAYAGKSAESTQLPVPDWDHPRLCGEKTALIACPQSEAGSPPPMRGKGN